MRTKVAGIPCKEDGGQSLDALNPLLWRRYANGEPDHLPVRARIRAGDRSPPVALKGYERAIDRVDMVYKSAFNPIDVVTKQRFSQANVCIEGQQ